ncbi:MAG TPA: 50S ribosomal protein L13 [Candidatus Tripitaka californicus]|uniref:50S ribosomal protein L13 n=1 Tax=Candidatus Tripitaka californicus TaxID=3367616 RepID=UPI004025B005|nr:50S ribosomal protein L13 [Planctomycetota bacterium]
MKTFIAKENQVDKKWHLVDAQGKTLGRMASRIATILQGKHRPIYTPHVDTGDYVVVINARKVRLTGKKLEEKTYQRFSGYPGGLKIIPLKEMLERHPDRVVKLAVRRMLPKTKLGESMLEKLKIYDGTEHPHTAQDPVELAIG